MTVTQQKLFYDERTNVDDKAAASQAAPDLHLNNNDFNPWNIKEFPTLLSGLNTLTSSVTGSSSVSVWRRGYRDNDVLDDDVWVGNNNEHRVRRWSHGGDGNDDMGQLGGHSCHMSRVTGSRWSHLNVTNRVTNVTTSQTQTQTDLDLGPQLDYIWDLSELTSYNKIGPNQQSSVILSSLILWYKDVVLTMQYSISFLISIGVIPLNQKLFSLVRCRLLL